MPVPRKTASLIGAAALFTTPAFASSSAVSPYAYEITEVLGLPITNAMLTGWVLSILLILVIRFMVGRATLIPGAGQAMVEGLVQWVYDTMAPIVGKKLIKKVFPLLLCLFTYILIMNWSGLLPGVGTFGHFVPTQEISMEEMQAKEDAGYVVREIDGKYYDGHFEYYFRPVNSDLNTTLALSIISFLAWIWFVLKYAGPKILLFDLFGNKADKNEVPGFIYIPLFAIFMGVGLIEVISILSRLVSLPFRLFGNVFGGENLLTSMHGMFEWVLPVPFYFLEILIGFVQALVFTLLTAVYIGLICNHDSAEEHAHAH
ncbi:F0F1 ATP synthase subunit A [Ruficoccus sp. ZRK36]|uniref:F0F1 ATP synthase subunit A n=1 Tax=Ruficoccus sp. ZRK36 TaxID=2866311 RepID=UPI001C73AB41|nr:F0F1 ATP synthase subunit A [Ruficoccus sp. ZRK36]QYY36614.1 F0F1 ATP synthase subunit A [Ruficoccus sp. ZRK36]